MSCLKRKHRRTFCRSPFSGLTLPCLRDFSAKPNNTAVLWDGSCLPLVPRGLLNNGHKMQSRWSFQAMNSHQMYSYQVQRATHYVALRVQGMELDSNLLPSPQCWVQHWTRWFWNLVCHTLQLLLCFVFPNIRANVTKNTVNKLPKVQGTAIWRYFLKIFNLDSQQISSAC